MKTREIKFRAWDETNKIMFTPESQIGHLWSFDCINGIPQSSGILMQYTGLKDKNGKEIYEGDIIGYYMDNELSPECYFISPVEYWASAFKVKHEGWLFLECIESPEVLGNIYENPELLEK